MAKKAEEEFKRGNEVDFKDGQGPKSKETPDHFPSDWHQKAEEEALYQNYLGLQHRLAELKGMPGAHPDQVAAAENDVAEARARLPKEVHKSSSKRPRRAKESR